MLAGVGFNVCKYVRTYECMYFNVMKTDVF